MAIHFVYLFLRTLVEIRLQQMTQPYYLSKTIVKK